MRCDALYGQSGKSLQGWAEAVMVDIRGRAIHPAALAHRNHKVRSRIGANPFISYLPNLQDYVVPKEYVVAMRRSMLNSCPVSSFEDVKSVVEQELGAPLSEVRAGTPSWPEPAPHSC